MKKAVSGILLILLLVGILALAFDIQPAESNPSTIIVPDDYLRIQAAIDHASDGDTIFVRGGPYYENVHVYRSVSLIGDEDGDKTIIIGDETDYTIRVTADNVSISGFEISNLWGAGVFLDHSSNSVLNRNTVKAVDAIFVNGGSRNNITYNRIEPTDSCVFHGIELWNSDYNVITGNYLGSYCHLALILTNSHNNYIAFNYISGHLMFVTTFKITDSNNNSIVGNTIYRPYPDGHISFVRSSGSVLYHNNLLSDGGPVLIYIDNASINTAWDDGYPSGGNYYGDYNGIDSYQGPYQNETGSDGIGDTPFTIVANHTDYYPLMNPWNSYTLTIRSVPFGVAVLVDFEYVYSTPWIETFNEGVVVSLVMPENISVGDTTYFWNKWSDESANRSRLVVMNSDVTLTAYYGIKYQLTVTSSPITGVPFTIDGTPQTTPYTEELFEGSHSLEVPPACESHNWSHWLEDDDANRTKTFTLDGNTTLTAVYIPSPAVGGIYIPANTLELFAPYIGLTTLLAVAAVTVVYAKKRKKI